jgi:Fe-S cluster assembly protein SufD
MSNTLLEATIHCLAPFDASHFDAILADETSPLLATARRTAFARYADTPNPRANDEEYRRTDPARFRMERFSPLAPLSPTPASTTEWDDAFDLVVEVSEAGWAIRDLRGEHAGGVTVCSLHEAAATHAALMEKYFYGVAGPASPRKFYDLNTAFFNTGFFVRVEKGVELEKGILIRYRLTTPQVALLPRLVIVGETMSRFTVVEDYECADGLPVLCCAAREFYAAPGAHVKLIALQEWGDQGVHIGEDWALIARDATVDLLTLTLGGRISKMTVGCDTNEPNANAYLGGLFFASGKQHFDLKTLQRHSSPNTYSNMLYKGAAAEKGYSVYQGIIQATKGSIHVDAYQTNNNLLLSPTARTDSLPGLIIDADELACSHGATMGNLDLDQLYYLRTRGVPELEARKMLVLGFFEEVVQRVPQSIIQDRLHADIELKLTQGFVAS